MAELLYVNDMKTCLTLLGRVDRAITKLSVKKEEYRDNLRKWLLMNNLKEHESFDEKEEEFWRLNRSTQNRRKCDLEKLESEYPDAYAACVETSESEIFKCQTVKSRKKNPPKAPKGR